MKSDFSIRLGLAGMRRVDVETYGRDLDRIMEPGVPFGGEYESVEVRTEKDGREVLFFSGDTTEDSESTETVFRDFLELHEAPSEDLAAFARRYGPLWICHHGHDLFECPRGCGQQERFTYSEPIEGWRAMIADAVTTLDVTAKVHAGKELVFDPSAWIGGRRIVDEAPYDALSGAVDGGGRVHLSRDDAIGLVTRGVSWWLRAGGVRIGFVWSRNGPSVDMPAYGLRGALAKNLLFTVCRVDGLAFCDNCARPFVPSRKPRKDQHTWCPRDECQKARYRASKRKQRAK